ncbi:MAG TPA: aliphatic sulfonate ABC transporter substrate-binding protein [Usitatibacteraceae bacterium]|nr:aliphatic sulfonate ABC transporter substrate-binding protein [Usitatibacteraceae bacterium]
MFRRQFLSRTAALVVAAAFVPLASAQALPEVRLDFAFYSPTSLVIRKFGWAEQEFAKTGTKVKWVQSAGSNRALEYLAANAVDFGSTAGLAAVLSKANGNPIRTVYVYSQPEWTALVVPKNSPIKAITDLKGKKIAATKGTDPFLFALRALNENGLHKNDVELVHLQHADGRAALEQGRVDAWAGLDPHMAASELDSGTRLLYRNVNFNTYGFLNTTEKFAQEQPEAVERVIRLYERARAWAKANPEEAAKILAEEAKISIAVAKRQLERTSFEESTPATKHAAALKSASSILLDEGLVKPGTNVAKVVDDLVSLNKVFRAYAPVAASPALLAALR